MAQLIHDSFFGNFIRSVSGGKILPHREHKDPSLLKPYQIADSGSSTASPSHSADDASAEKGGNETPEKQGNGQDENIIVGWYGDDDPENPQNWSNFTKCFVTFELCYLTFAVYVGSSIYSPGTMDVMETFGVSEVVATLGLSVFVLGYAIGPMMLAPVSEFPTIGRNPVYIYTLVLFVVLQIPTALSTHIAMLVVFRFVTGVLGSPALAIGGASFAEMYTPQKRALAIGLWGMGAVCGPVLGPLIGGYATEAYSWRWTIWSLMIIAAAALIMLVFLLPETSSKNILYRRAQRIKKLTGNDKVTTQAEQGFKYVTFGKIARMVTIQPWILTFTELIIFLLNAWVALIFGILFVWFYSLPLVFSGIYGFSLGSSGLAFLGLLIGALISLPFFCWYILKIQSKQFNDKGQIIKPEMRLPPAMVGAFFIPICLFWFGWSADPDIHWIVPILGTCLFSSGVLYILNAVLNYLPDAYPTEVASVMSGNAFIRFASGAGFPLFAPAMFDRLGIHWATTLLALLALCFAPIPFLFSRYGEKIRQKSKRARQD